MKYLVIFSIFLIVFSANFSLIYAQETDQIRIEYCEKNWRENPDMCTDFIPEGYFEETAPKEFTELDRIKLEQLQARSIESQSTNFGDNFANLNFSDYVLPIVIVIVIIFVIVGIAKAYVNRHPTMPADVELGLRNNFSSWDDYKFENFIADVHKKLGHHTTLTARGPDQGVDVIAEKGGKRKIIQVKRWANNVGNTDVLKTVGAMQMYDADEAVVITTSDFSASAYEVLRKTPNLKLINMDQLREIVLKAYRKSK